MTRKPSDLSSTLAELSGVSKSTAKSLFEEAKTNIKMLDLCSGPHDFVPLEKGLLSKCRCIKCGGTLDSLNVHWYERGLAHGKCPA